MDDFCCPEGTFYDQIRAPKGQLRTEGHRTEASGAGSSALSLFNKSQPNNGESMRKVIALGLFLLAPSQPTMAQAPPAIRIQHELVHEGDVLLQGQEKRRAGERRPDSCTYPKFEVVVTARPGRERGLDLRNDENCRLVVVSKFDRVGSGPKSMDEYRKQKEARRGNKAALDNPIANKFQAVVFKRPLKPVRTSFASGTKLVYQDVFMYGYGGEWDKLTHKTGALEFQYNGSTATTIYRDGDCAGSITGWVVLQCVDPYFQLDGPRFMVYRHAAGVYSWAFAWTTGGNIAYIHTLEDNETGWSDGLGVCSYYVSGDIVLGVSNTCQVTNSN